MHADDFLRAEMRARRLKLALIALLLIDLAAIAIAAHKAITTT